jgi:hypothetical protein
MTIGKPGGRGTLKGQRPWVGHNIKTDVREVI